MLAAVNDVAQLAAYVRELSSDHERRVRLAEAGRQRAVSKFSVSEGVSAYLETYMTVMRDEKH